MNKKYILLALIFIFSIAIFSYQIAYARFSSSASNNGNVISASSKFPTIIINEVFPDDGARNKQWIELYNQTGSAVNVSGWKIANGNTVPKTDTFLTVSPIPSGGYAVIVGKDTNVTGIPSSAIIITLDNKEIGDTLDKNGNPIILKNAADVVIDKMSYGSDTSVFMITPPPNNDKSLARKPNGTDTDTAGDWFTNSIPTIGGSN